MRPMLEIQQLSKEYTIASYRHRYSSLRDALTFGWKRKLDRGAKESFWALKDISFQVQAGETLGIIGHNGAGKSTLLKIISRITPPSSGRIILHGRVASLLEVGTGFHPELTGLENIYLNGALLGLKKKEIRTRLNEIVDFSGVEKFLETPLKHFSTGMQLRLAFAVAAHLQPDILVVDEVLAVGDAAFQKKCLGKMESVSKDEGRTVLFVSHDLSAVERLCQRCLLLESGCLISQGHSQEVIGQYMQRIDQQQQTPLESRSDRKGNGAFRFTSIKLMHNANGEQVLSNLTDAAFQIYYQLYTDHFDSIRIDIGLNNQYNQRLTLLSSSKQVTPFRLNAQKGCFEIRFSHLPLYPGNYSLDLYCEVDHQIADWVVNAYSFRVATSSDTPVIQAKNPGLFQPDYRFSS